jgi:tetratricopeptide (TPR) repeat protein
MNFLSLKNKGLLFLAFAVIIFIVFGNALFNDFCYDDHYLILENPYIRDFTFIKQALVSDVTITTPLQKASGYYRPVSMIYLMALSQLWGMNPFGLHLMNIFLHLLNTFFVFLIAEAMIKDRRVAFLAGLLFAVHPIHVEAVAPIFNYMGLLASCFAFASFYMFIRSEGMRKAPETILSLVFFSLGLFSKEEVIVLPFLFILYDFIFLYQLSFQKIELALRKYLWFFLPMGLYLFLRSQIIESKAAFGFWDLSLNLNIAGESTAILTLISVARTFAAYLGLFVFPFKLSAFYLFGPVSSMGSLEIFISLFLVMGLLAYGVFSAKKESFVSFFIGWFFISSFLISNLIPIGGLFAERFMYFPSMAYCFLFALLFIRLFDQCLGASAQTKRFLLQIFLIIAVVLYAQKTAARNYVWRNDVTLWADTVQKTPQSMIVHLFLADAYHARGLYDKAMDEYAIVLGLPSAPEARVRNTLGKIYGGRQQYDQAIGEFLKAVKINPFDVETYYNLGITYFFKGDDAKAREYFRQAQSVDKDYFWVYYGMGLIYEKEKKYKEAKDMFSKALTLKADFTMAQSALARLP